MLHLEDQLDPSGGRPLVVLAHSLGSVIICNARPIPDDMIASAREEGIALFRTPLSQFEVSGQLYAVLHGLSAIPRSDAPVANRA